MSLGGARTSVLPEILVTKPKTWQPLLEKKALFHQKHIWGKVFFISIVTPVSWVQNGRPPRGRPLITSSTCCTVVGSLGGHDAQGRSRGALSVRLGLSRFLWSDASALILSAVGDPRRRLGPLRPHPDGDPRQPGGRGGGGARGAGFVGAARGFSRRRVSFLSGQTRLHFKLVRPCSQSAVLYLLTVLSGESGEPAVLKTSLRLINVFTVMMLCTTPKEEEEETGFFHSPACWKRHPTSCFFYACMRHIPGIF